jgi:hypothetical protein
MRRLGVTQTSKTRKPIIERLLSPLGVGRRFTPQGQQSAYSVEKLVAEAVIVIAISSI